MTIIQFSAKVPRYAALFFPKDKTTAIVPTDNIQTETFKDKDVITVNFNDENLSAEIILMSSEYFLDILLVFYWI